MKKCKTCLGVIRDHRGARGMCHNCYENWRYRKNPEKILAVNRRSYEKHRAKRLLAGRRWRRENAERKAEMDRNYRLNNLAAFRRYQKRYRTKNKAELRDAFLRRKFGIGHDEYLALSKKQKHRCAICQKRRLEAARVHLCIDHCHKTKRVRGLLCGPCNRAIGLMDDNPATLTRAARYVLKCT